MLYILNSGMVVAEPKIISEDIQSLGTGPVIESIGDIKNTQKPILLWIKTFKSNLRKSENTLLKKDLCETLGFLEELNIPNEYLLKKLSIVTNNYLELLQQEGSLDSNAEAVNILNAFKLEIDTWKNAIPQRKVLPDFGGFDVFEVIPAVIKNADRNNSPKSVFGNQVDVTVLEETTKFSELYELLLVRCREFCIYLKELGLPNGLGKIPYDFEGIINSQTIITPKNIGAYIVHIQTFLKAKSSCSELKDAVDTFTGELDLFAKRFKSLETVVQEA